MNYEVDGLTPERTVRPTTIDELSAALAEAHAAGSAVIPWGGGTRMHVGNFPSRYDIALDLTGLSRNIEHEPGDLTVVVDAGVRVADLQRALAGAGQRLPFDVPEPEKATIGGSVASNAAGHMRSSLGGIRDWIIGMKIVLADGTITKTGGRVVKNVQGYDLHRLHTGAYGTLGVIAEVAFKLTPLPRQSRTVAAWFGSLEGAQRLVMGTFNGPMLPEAVTVFAGRNAESALQGIPQADDGRVLVLARVTGGESAVSRQVDDLTGAAGALDAAGYGVFDGKEATGLWQKAVADAPELKVMARSTLKPESAFRFAAAALKMGEEASVEVHGGFGTVLAGLPDGGIAEAVALRNAARQHGGNTVIERCPQNVKQELDVFSDPGESLALMRSVKQRFDPAGLLNPGRFVGRI